jgi:transposase-like protein
MDANNRPLSKYLQRRVIAAFANQLTASEAARVLRINRNTINRYYRLLRERIAEYEWNRQRAAGLPETALANTPEPAPAQAVLALAEHRGHWVARWVPQRVAKSLQGRFGIGRALVANGWNRVDGLVIDGHELVAHTPTVRESLKRCWQQARTLIAQYYGVRAEHAALYLREVEFRLNTRREEMEGLLWNLLNNPRAALR